MSFVAALQIYVSLKFSSLLVEVTDAPPKFQVELTELRYNSILRNGFNQECLPTFCAALPLSLLSALSKHEIWPVYLVHMYMCTGFFTYETNKST